MLVRSFGSKLTRVDFFPGNGVAKRGESGPLWRKLDLRSPVISGGELNVRADREPLGRRDRERSRLWNSLGSASPRSIVSASFRFFARVELMSTTESSNFAAEARGPGVETRRETFVTLPPLGESSTPVNLRDFFTTEARVRFADVALDALLAVLFGVSPFGVAFRLLALVDPADPMALRTISGVFDLAKEAAETVLLVADEGVLPPLGVRPAGVLAAVTLPDTSTVFGNWAGVTKLYTTRGLSLRLALRRDMPAAGVRTDFRGEGTEISSKT